MPVWCLVMLSLRFIRSYVMMLKKSSEALMRGIVDAVKAIMSLIRPGTAAEMSFSGPSAARISDRSWGYASISHAFSAFGTFL